MIYFIKIDYNLIFQVKAMGYEVAHNGKCITVFSAPNYCDSMDNLGAFITINGNELKPNFTTYEAVVSNNKYAFTQHKIGRMK